MVNLASRRPREGGLSRLSLQDGPSWRAFCYHDIRSYSLDSDLLILHHIECVIALRGINLRQLYLSLLVEEVYEIPLHTAQIPSMECPVTEISIQQISIDAYGEKTFSPASPESRLPLSPRPNPRFA